MEFKFRQEQDRVQLHKGEQPRNAQPEMHSQKSQQQGLMAMNRKNKTDKSEGRLHRESVIVGSREHPGLVLF